MPRRFTEKKRCEWLERIRLQQESGQNMSHWCREQQINYDSFLYWKKRFSPAPHPLNRAAFQELTSGQETGVSIEYRGVRIHVDKCFDCATLRSCLSALSGIECWQSLLMPVCFSVGCLWTCARVLRAWALLYSKCSLVSSYPARFSSFSVAEETTWKFSIGMVMDLRFSISDWRRAALLQNKGFRRRLCGESSWCS